MNEPQSPPTPRDNFWFLQGMREGFTFGALAGFAIGAIVAFAVFANK